MLSNHSGQRDDVFSGSKYIDVSRVTIRETEIAERNPTGPQAERQTIMSERNGQAERNSFQQWAETQQPHIVADVNLAVRQQPKEKRERHREEIQGGDTGSERARSESERKWWARLRQTVR